MKLKKIISCVFVFILGMLVIHMFSNVGGCKSIVEGQQNYSFTPSLRRRLNNHAVLRSWENPTCRLKRFSYNMRGKDISKLVNQYHREQKLLLTIPNQSSDVPQETLLDRLLQDSSHMMSDKTLVVNQATGNTFNLKWGGFSVSGDIAQWLQPDKRFESAIIYSYVVNNTGRLFVMNNRNIGRTGLPDGEEDRMYHCSTEYRDGQQHWTGMLANAVADTLRDNGRFPDSTGECYYAVDRNVSHPCLIGHQDPNSDIYIGGEFVVFVKSRNLYIGVDTSSGHMQDHRPPPLGSGNLERGNFIQCKVVRDVIKEILKQEKDLNTSVSPDMIIKVVSYKPTRNSPAATLLNESMVQELDWMNHMGFEEHSRRGRKTDDDECEILDYYDIDYRDRESTPVKHIKI